MKQLQIQYKAYSQAILSGEVAGPLLIQLDSRLDPDGEGTSEEESSGSEESDEEHDSETEGKTVGEQK